MFESLFDVPLVIAGPAIIGSLCLFAISGLLLVRRRVLPRLRIHDEDSHFSGAMVHSVMVFYGLALALIAVNVFETYARRFEDHFTRGDLVGRAVPGCECLSRAGDERKNTF